MFQADGQMHRRTGRRTHMTKLIVTFRNFANSPNKLSPYRGYCQSRVPPFLLLAVPVRSILQVDVPALLPVHVNCLLFPERTHFSWRMPVLYIIPFTLHCNFVVTLYSLSTFLLYVYSFWSCCYRLQSLAFGKHRVLNNNNNNNNAIWMSSVTGLFFLVLLLNQQWIPPLRLQASHCFTLQYFPYYVW
jgi:hypothetical protein